MLRSREPSTQSLRCTLRTRWLNRPLFGRSADTLPRAGLSDRVGRRWLQIRNVEVTNHLVWQSKGWVFPRCLGHIRVFKESNRTIRQWPTLLQWVVWTQPGPPSREVPSREAPIQKLVESRVLRHQTVPIQWEAIDSQPAQKPARAAQEPRGAVLRCSRSSPASQALATAERVRALVTEWRFPEQTGPRPREELELVAPSPHVRPPRSRVQEPPDLARPRVASRYAPPAPSTKHPRPRPTMPQQQPRASSACDPGRWDARRPVRHPGRATLLRLTRTAC